MAIHHIIPKHEWKKRFGSLRGVNAPDNLSPPLYNEQHAQVHLHYYNEITHLECDRIANLAISKQIGKEEANILATKAANTGKIHNKKSRNNMSEAHRDYVMPEEQKRKISQRLMGRGEWNIGRIPWNKGLPGNTSPLGPQPKLTCSVCGKIGGRSLMKRYHFQNCPKYEKS